MSRVLAAALLSVLTITASAGLASAATQGAAANGTVTPSVTAPVSHDKAIDAKAIDKSKPAATKKKDKTVSANTVSHPAGKTLETGKPMTKPAS
jgi:hypothetical protein